jgi:hypothetical protein
LQAHVRVIRDHELYESPQRQFEFSVVEKIFEPRYGFDLHIDRGLDPLLTEIFGGRKRAELRGNGRGESQNQAQGSDKQRHSQ